MVAEEIIRLKEKKSKIITKEIIKLKEKKSKLITKEIMGWKGKKAIDGCGRTYGMERREIKDNTERNHKI